MLFIFLLVLVAAVLVAMAVRVVREGERGVVFRLGRVARVQGPGVVVTTPLVDRVKRVSLRTVTFPVSSPGLLTRDNATVTLHAAVFARVVDPVKALVEVESHFLAAAEVVRTSLREAVGQTPLDALLHEPATVGERVKALVDARTKDWGVEAERVDIKDVELPETVRRALSRTVESWEREVEPDPEPEPTWRAGAEEL